MTDALADDTTEAVDEAFENLDADLMGIGEVVGWDADLEGVQLHVWAEEPERVIAIILAALRTLGTKPPWRLVAADPKTGTILYERALP